METLGAYQGINDFTMANQTESKVTYLIMDVLCISIYIRALCKSKSFFPNTESLQGASISKSKEMMSKCWNFWIFQQSNQPWKIS